ncbi:MAG: hypothetical protein ACYCXW_05950 [Solirubrobacteraceae bacterium]
MSRPAPANQYSRALSCGDSPRRSPPAGAIVAALQMGGFFFVLLHAGWHPGVPVGPGQRLHHAYLEATTMSFVGMMAGQIGTAFAALFVYVPPFQGLLDTAALPARDLLFLAPYPFVVWGADELRRWLVRHGTWVAEQPHVP